jgi:hypothetical protein
MTFPGPFSWTNQVVLMPHPFPYDEVARLRSTIAAFDRMGIALVDISGPSNVTFASNFTKTAFAASLPKIAAMYAAHYLQARLKAIAGALGPRATLGDVEATLRKEWRAPLKALLPRSVGDSPDVTAIFASRAFDFAARFEEDLDLMIKDSDNAAAGRCIRRIGYDYINGSLIHGGFYSVSESSGLWIAGDYTPGTHPSNRDGARAPGLATSQAASAKSVALLLVNLARGTLIGAEASASMRDVMSGASSWVRASVEARRPDAVVYGKVGLVQKGAAQGAHDCAIVRYAGAHYVIVTLFGPAVSLDALHDELDRVARKLFSIRLKSTLYSKGIITW